MIKQWENITDLKTYHLVADIGEMLQSAVVVRVLPNLGSTFSRLRTYFHENAAFPQTSRECSTLMAAGLESESYNRLFSPVRIGFSLRWP